jgi:hypothetical protein
MARYACRMSNLVKTVLVAAAMVIAIYAVAATAARSVARTFTSTEATTRARMLEFAEGTQRAAQARKATRAKCKLLAGPHRKACDAEARAQERKGFTIARQL